MSAAVFKAIFEHRRWQTSRVVHFVPESGTNLFVAAELALAAALTERLDFPDYELRSLYYLGAPEEQPHEHLD